MGKGNPHIRHDLVDILPAILLGWNAQATPRRKRGKSIVDGNVKSIGCKVEDPQVLGKAERLQILL